MQLIFFLLPLIVGIAITTQTGVNSQLRLAVGSPLVAAFISFFVGTVILAALVLVTNQPLPTSQTLLQIGWTKYMGGLLGAFFVTVVIVSASRVSASSLFALIVAGQLITALIYDHFGLLGFKQTSATPTRIAGALLLIASAYFLNRK